MSYLVILLMETGILYPFHLLSSPRLASPCLSPLLSSFRLWTFSWSSFRVLRLLNLLCPCFWNPRGVSSRLSPPAVHTVQWGCGLELRLLALEFSAQPAPLHLPPVLSFSSWGREGPGHQEHGLTQGPAGWQTGKCEGTFQLTVEGGSSVTVPEGRKVGRQGRVLQTATAGIWGIVKLKCRDANGLLSSVDLEGVLQMSVTCPVQYLCRKESQSSPKGSPARCEMP